MPERANNPSGSVKLDDIIGEEAERQRLAGEDVTDSIEPVEEDSPSPNSRAPPTREQRPKLTRRISTSSDKLIPEDNHNSDAVKDRMVEK